MKSLIDQIKAEHPTKPFIALGQTVLWDEPLKAVWRKLLDTHSPESNLIAGVHDTDYFAKTNALISSDQPYAMLAHDDLRTRGLWSAAGEMSSLFGSEDLPTISDYKANGVAINRLADSSKSHIDMLSRVTEAWGWRGLVSTSPKQIIAHDVLLANLLPTLIGQLNWAFTQSAECLPKDRQADCTIQRDSIISHLRSMPAGTTLTQAYQSLFPQFYSNLLGKEPANFSTTASSDIFKFNKSTAHLPRFSFVNLFLDPKSRRICCDAYDKAVAGGGMYTLETFGVGALPFDIAVPGIGRGTLHITASQVTIDLPGQHAFKAENVTIRSCADLADLLEPKLGSDIALVGKAVSLMSMIASEFVIVFHETASGYTDRTAAMNDTIRAAGLSVDLAPIVRLQYPTWDALKCLGSDTTFRLPQHLATAFGKNEITADEFASRWSDVVSDQSKKLSDLRKANSVRLALKYLHDSGDISRCWNCDLDTYERATKKLTERSDELNVRRAYVKELRRERYELRAGLVALQQEMGDHFRTEIAPRQHQPGAKLAAALQRRETYYSAGIKTLKAQIRQWTRVIKALRADIRETERSEKSLKLRADITAITNAAELAKLHHVRAALITSRALPHINSRPSAWWLPLVDPSGKWFTEIADGAKARLEKL